MSTRNYERLALAWVPDSQEKKHFYLIVGIMLALAIVLAIIVSSVDVPPKERKPRTEIPERVAKFITEKKKVEPPKPKPKATPPPPKPTPKPKVARKKDTEERKPLTEVEKKAREKAAESGVMAFASELADLIDTSDVDDALGSKVKKSSSNAKKASAINTDVLTAGADQGSGGVSTESYVGGVGSTQLSKRDVALVKQSLNKSDELERKPSAESGERTGNVRTEEEVTMVFDQNKGKLFSIYNRERRKKPGLMGKLVLEITIAPDGSVSNVKVASTELNDPSLERRIMLRVKQFKFEAKDVEPVTVTFPIEFLPS